MSLVINKLKNKIATRGLGPNTGILVQPFNLTQFIQCVVREEEEYHPTTGVFSEEENIDGWCYDKAPAQDYSNIETTVISSLGGYKYNLKEGLLNEDFQGSCVGCELVEVEEGYTNRSIWTPKIEVGNYYINGEEKRLFSRGSICVVAEEANVTLIEKWDQLKLGTTQAAMFYRDDNFVNSIYKNFEFSLDEETKTISITNYEEKKVGVEGLEASWKSFGILRSGSVSYLKYFPIKEILFNQELIEGEDYILDKELGVISWKKNQFEEMKARYTACARLDFEVVENYFKTNKLNLKPYLYRQPSGIIEISSEERNLRTLKLTSNKDAISIGAETCLLTCEALNALDKPVDEINVTFLEVDEVFYEGNLKELVDTTNASGEAFARASFPFKNNSLSYFINKGGIRINGNESIIRLPSDVSEDAALEDFYLFEVLKVDPFLGSNGITFNDVSIEYIRPNPPEGGILILPPPEAAKKFKATLNDYEGIRLEKELYKIHRNDLKNPLNIPRETDVSSFETIYNVGNLKIGSSNIDVVITNIVDNIIYFELKSPRPNSIIAITSITLFKKNENEEGVGVDRICYKAENLQRLIPVNKSYNAGHCELKYDVALSKESLISGYRIFYPKSKFFQCKAIDPASSFEIFSNIVTIKTRLSEKYLDELKIYDKDNDVSRLGGASYLTINPDTNNTILNLRLIGSP